LASNLLLSLGYDRIISESVLACVPRAVNVHFGMLPKYRGSFSIPWAILNADAQIGVTLHDIAGSIDDGAIIRQESILNERHLSCRQLYERAVEVGVELTRWFVDQVAVGSAPTGLVQDEENATYYSSSYPNGFRIPW